MNQITETENFLEYKYVIEFYSKDELLNLSEHAEAILARKNHNDTLKIELFDQSLDEYISSEQNINTIDFTPLFEDTDADSDEFRLSLTIKKNSFSIYSYEKFLSHIQALEFKYILNNFNDFTTNNPDNMSVKELDLFLTSTLCSDTKNKVNRESLISLMGDSVNAFGFPSHSLLPNDFDFDYSSKNKLPNEFNEFIRFLEKIKGLLSLFFLCDFIELERNIIKLKINNTYSFHYNFDFFNVKFYSNEIINELFEIYQWVYDNPNTKHVQDKLELARIQIAKNLTFNDNVIYLKNNGIINNLNSMYKIYLKENVDQYISATNKVAEIISEMNYKQSEITASFTNSLKTNSTLLIGFFISLVVYNNLSAGKTSVFNNSNFVLVILFTIISAISLALSIRQVNRNLERTTNYFDKQKEIYSHLFSKDDVKQLFSTDFLTNMKKSVKSDRNLYTAVWIIELTLILLTSFIATYYPASLPKIIEFLKPISDKK